MRLLEQSPTALRNITKYFLIERTSPSIKNKGTVRFLNIEDDPISIKNKGTVRAERMTIETHMLAYSIF